MRSGEPCTSCEGSLKAEPSEQVLGLIEMNVMKTCDNCVCYLSYHLRLLWELMNPTKVRLLLGNSSNKERKSNRGFEKK